MRLQVEINKIWKTENPHFEGEYICRMRDNYIKMCYYKNGKWSDMWQSNDITINVFSWMYIPYDK